MNRKPHIQPESEDLIRQAAPAFPVPKKEYKEEVKERVVKTFTKHLENLGYSHGTILVAKRSITEFLEKNPNYKVATKTTITDHYEYLKQRPNKTRPGNLSDSVVSMHMYSLRLFYDFLEQTGIIENPTTRTSFPKAKYNERAILTREEIKQLYEAAETMKEKTFLALFYGCGLRRSEAEKLNVQDIDIDSGLLYVREGKGRKRRVIPMSGKVKTDVENYITHERKFEIKLQHEESLMINGHGTRMTKSTYYKFFGRLLVKSGIEKSVSIHNLRHTIATHLLEKNHKNTNQLIINLRGQPETGEGINYLVETMRHKYPDRKLNVRTIRQSVIANLLKPVSAGGKGKGLREVQYFAGHRKISSTERYRQTGLEELKTAIMKYHPVGHIMEISKSYAQGRPEAHGW
jgi:integrase/recombinase XerD